MHKSTLELLLPEKIVLTSYHKQLEESKIMGPSAYKLDWAWIFEKMDKWMKAHNKNHCVILDVGCGNGMFHPFLERYFGQGIIGIDRTDSTLTKKEILKLGHQLIPSTDYCMNFINEGGNVFNENMVDIIYWLSSIEHNSIDEIRKAIDTSLKALKPGGLFLATWAFGYETHWSEAACQTVLSMEDAENVFGGEWIDNPDFSQAVDQYRTDIMGLDTWHFKRFGSNKYDYVHAGCMIEKDR